MITVLITRPGIEATVDIPEHHASDIKTAVMRVLADALIHEEGDGPVIEAREEVDATPHEAAEQTCDQCSKAFRNARALAGHRAAMHAGRTYPCASTGCSFEGKTAGHLGMHRKRAHADGAERGWPAKAEPVTPIAGRATIEPEPCPELPRIRQAFACIDCDWVPDSSVRHPIMALSQHRRHKHSAATA